MDEFFTRCFSKTRFYIVDYKLFSFIYRCLFNTIYHRVSHDFNQLHNTISQASKSFRYPDSELISFILW